MRRKLVLIAAAAGVIVGGSGAILVRAMRDLPDPAMEAIRRFPR